MRKIYYALVIAIVSLWVISCQKESFYKEDSANLRFSTDTITFDTVFSTIGTTTKRLRVYNPYNKTIRISSIELGTQESSNFRINVDGIRANQVTNIEIPPKDSLFIFVEATIDPTLQDAPMVINDSIIFITNGNLQDVNLVAWGQDVHLLNNEILMSQVWTKDKPYLIYNAILVDTGEVLTIESGVNIHLHKNANIFVAGSIEAKGTLEEPITFQGDRLESFYEDITEQWSRIVILNGSSGNIFEHCLIKNGIIGLNIGTLDDGPAPDVTLHNTHITNMSSAGIFALNANVKAYNTVISNCGQYLFTTILGGEYEFIHCTLANYWGGPSNRRTPSVIFKNYLDYVYLDENDEEQEGRLLGNLNKALFANSIIYGNSMNEIFIDAAENQKMNFTIDQSLLKLRLDSIPESFRSNFVDCIFNENPEFVAPDKFIFELDTLSAAKDAGDGAITQLFPLLEWDMMGNNRLEDAAPDLGAFERIESEE